MSQSDDDNIPDINEFLYMGDDYSPELFLKMLMSIGRGQASNDLVLKTLTDQFVKHEQTMEKVVESLQNVVLSNNDTKNEIKAVNARVDDRKEESKKHLQLIEKLFEKVESFDTELHTSCDIYNQRNTKYTDDRVAEAEARSLVAIDNAVNSAYGKVKIGWLISSVSVSAIVGLLLYIFGGMKDDINANDLHTRDTKIHLKAK